MRKQLKALGKVLRPWPAQSRDITSHGPGWYAEASQKTDDRTLAILFASAQLAADQEVFAKLDEGLYTDHSLIAFALAAIKDTRKMLQEALLGAFRGKTRRLERDRAGNRLQIAGKGIQWPAQDGPSHS